MEKTIEIIKNIRVTFIKLMDSLTIDDVNKIPTNFNNNIAWNFCHMVVTQQGLCYVRAGQKTMLEQSLIAKYKSGTKPEGFIDQSELDYFKQLSENTLNAFEKDIEGNKSMFNDYKKFTTGFGFEIADIDDAKEMLLLHEGLHTGYTMALRKAILI